MANIGVMGWEVPSLQEIHLKLIFQGSLPYRCVSESKWHTKERKTEWQWKTDALHSDICMHHWYSFTMVHPCKCTQILTNTSNRSSCNPSPAVSLCTTHVGKHSVIIPPEHSVFVWVCVCLREVHGMECFGSAKWNNAWKRESIDEYLFLFFFCISVAVNAFCIIHNITKVCFVCVYWPWTGLCSLPRCMSTASMNRFNLLVTGMLLIKKENKNKKAIERKDETAAACRLNSFQCKIKAWHL